MEEPVEPLMIACELIELSTLPGDDSGISGAAAVLSRSVQHESRRDSREYPSQVGTAAGRFDRLASAIALFRFVGD